MQVEIMDYPFVGLRDSLAQRIPNAAREAWVAILIVFGLIGCTAGGPNGGWNGTVDTLASGQVVVRNSDEIGRAHV